MNQDITKWLQGVNGYDEKNFNRFHFVDDLWHDFAVVTAGATDITNIHLYYIYVYDSNRPALNDLRIEVQMNTNTWKHSYYTLNKFITGKISVKVGIGNILVSNTGGQKGENLKKAKALK